MVGSVGSVLYHLFRHSCYLIDYCKMIFKGDFCHIIALWLSPHCIEPNSPKESRCDTRLSFKLSKTSLNLKFSFSQIDSRRKAFKNSDFSEICSFGRHRFIPFQRIWACNERQTDTSRDRTQVIDSISYDDNRNPKCASVCIMYVTCSSLRVRLIYFVFTDIRGSLNKFPDFFRMGTFIDSTHMKL